MNDFETLNENIGLEKEDEFSLSDSSLLDDFGTTDRLHSFDNSNHLWAQENEMDNTDLEIHREDNLELDDKKDISFTGKYKCTCGCTNFIDVGHNYCSCGHHWDRHKFWST